MSGPRARMRLAGLAALWLGVQTVALATPFVYHDYDSLVVDLNDLAARFPELTDLTTAQAEYGLPPDGGGQYEQYILRITNEATGLDKPEVLILGTQHGDEVVGVEVSIETARLLLEQYGRDPWLTALIDRREIYIMPLVNPDGFERGRRWSPGSEGGSEDMNRDHLYDRDCAFFCEDDVSLSTVGAQAIHELARRHLFRVMLDYHGGAELILHPWGTPLHSNNTESPDETTATVLGLRMRDFGGPFSGFYPVGTANDLLGPVRGPLDDTSYASSWDPGNSDPLHPTDGWRAVGYTIEISNQKSPPQGQLGGDADILTPGGAEDGFVPKNVRIALAGIDIAEPWIEWSNRDEIPLQVSVGEPVNIEWSVRGCFEVDDTHVRWGMEPDPLVSFTDQTPPQQDDSETACFGAPTSFAESVSFLTPGTFFLTPAARVDERLLQQGNPVPNVPPQTWLARVRTEDGLLFENDFDPGEVNTVRGQLYWGGEPLQIEVVAGEAYILSEPDPGQGGVENAWSISGATPESESFLLGGRQAGSREVPGCPGLTVAIADINLLGSAIADAQGVATVTRDLPEGVSGETVRFQAVELGTCTVSNLVSFTFP